MISDFLGAYEYGTPAQVAVVGFCVVLALVMFWLWYRLETRPRRNSELAEAINRAKEIIAAKMIAQVPTRDLRAEWLHDCEFMQDLDAFADKWRGKVPKRPEISRDMLPEYLCVEHGGQAKGHEGKYVCHLCHLNALKQFDGATKGVEMPTITAKAGFCPIHCWPWVKFDEGQNCPECELKNAKKLIADYGSLTGSMRESLKKTHPILFVPPFKSPPGEHGGSDTSPPGLRLCHRGIHWTNGPLCAQCIGFEINK